MLKTKHIVIILSLIVFVGANLRLAQAQSLSSQNQRAAAKNSELQYSLRWTFGRKRQRGWYLYVPLLQKTLGTSSRPNSVEFADSVYQWQKRRGIRPTGILDSKTLYSFIKHWQSKRLRPIVLAKDYQLLSAPIREFFDPTRDADLLKVEKQTYAAYKKMLAAAIDDESLNLKIDGNGSLLPDEKFLTLISTYRSPKYQAGLRAKQPGATRAQIAFKSPHFTGKALDIYVGGEPVTTKDYNRALQIKTPVYLWLVENAERFGFYNYFYEPWHWEYAPKTNETGK